MLKRLLLGGLVSGFALSGIGCGLCCQKHKNRDTVPPPRSGGVFLDDPLPTPRGGGGIPPPSVPTTPLDSLPPPSVPESRGSFRIDPGTSPGPWTPAPGSSPRSDLPPTPPPRSDKKELLFPDPIIGGSAPSSLDLPPDKRSSARGLLEEPVRPSDSNDLSPKTDAGGKSPSTQQMPSDRPATPDATARAAVGLPGFAKVPGHDGIATGRKPTLDGLDWLKANGYRTVVYLHAPSADVSPARNLAERRGLRFVPIAVSPGTLKRAYDEFAAVVGDRSARPVYVADEDGVRAGSLFYLLFRTSDLRDADSARVLAAPLGLAEAGSEEQRQFWVAINDILAKR